MHIKFTNIGLGLATQMLFEGFGEQKLHCFISKDSFNDLNPFFIQPNKSYEFIILVQVIKGDSTKDLSISYTDILGNLYSQQYKLSFQSNTIFSTNEGDYPTDFRITVSSEDYPILKEAYEDQAEDE